MEEKSTDRFNDRKKQACRCRERWRKPASALAPYFSSPHAGPAAMQCRARCRRVRDIHIMAGRNGCSSAPTARNAAAPPNIKPKGAGKGRSFRYIFGRAAGLDRCRQRQVTPGTRDESRNAGMMLLKIGRPMPSASTGQGARLFEFRPIEEVHRRKACQHHRRRYPDRTPALGHAYTSLAGIRKADDPHRAIRFLFLFGLEAVRRASASARKARGKCRFRGSASGRPGRRGVGPPCRPRSAGECRADSER